MFTSRNESSLRIFALGTLIAVTVGAVFNLIIGPLQATYPLFQLLAISIVGGVGAIITLYLLRQGQPNMAAYVFTFAVVLTITLALIVTGTKTGTSAIFVFPIATAALLLGVWPGVLTLLVCSAITLILSVLEDGRILVPALPAGSSALTYSFNVVLAFTLVMVVSAVAGGNTRRALAESEERAKQLEKAYASLSQATTVGASVTSEARGLAATLVSSSAQQEASASTAASAIAQITAQISELSATATQIAASARQIRDVSDRTHEMAEDTRARLDKDRDQLSQAVQAGEQLQTAARQVGDNVKQMGQILSLITEVAEETHMLSLNATIEATGSGETGRRFRVIAAEVGSLASKVNSSTEQVGAIVQNVQRTVQAMIGVANQAVDSIKRSQIANLTTGEQINQVSQAASEVAREGFLIVSSTEQQRRASSEIDNAISGVANVSRQAEDASKQLANIASELNLTVDRLAAILPTQAAAEVANEGDNNSDTRGNGLRITTRLGQPEAA